MGIELLEHANAVLREDAAHFVFVGGTTIDLYVTERGGSTSRATIDVDVVVDVASRLEYERVADCLRQRGFSEDSTSTVICRWRHGSGLLLDVMPTSADVFGFTNRWYPEVITSASRYLLPSGDSIQICHPARLIATKLAAFDERGAQDPLASHDLDDIVRVFDGRPGLVEEIAGASDPVLDYLANRFAELLETPLFPDAVRGLLLPDPGSQSRADQLVLPRMRRVADLRG